MALMLPRFRNMFSDRNYVYWVRLKGEGRRLATLNLVPGTVVYGENLVKRGVLSASF